MNEELKNCPFCGNKVELIPNQDGNIFHVYCPVCEARNLWSVNATELWNNRTHKDTSLLPCPICDHKGHVYESQDATFCVTCFQCGVGTKYFDNPDDARSAWNRRP